MPAAPIQAGPFSFEVDDRGIGVLTFDLADEKVNKLSVSLLGTIRGLMDRIAEMKGLRAVVFRSGKPDQFIVGADLEDLGKVTDAAEGARLSREAHAIFARLENMPAPVVAAIHGACVGGGTEMVLACAYRVCSDDPKTVLALPEVKIGLFPGAGGTQRLPRLVGIEQALDMILTGKNVYPRKALQIGLVDEVCSKHILLDVARAAAEKLADGRIPRRRGPKGSVLRRALLEANPLGRKFLFHQAEKTVLAKTHGCYPAPLRAIEAIRAGIELAPEEEGYRREAELFGEVASGPIAKGLIGLFFDMQEAKKETGAPEPPLPVKKLGLLGAGFMGAGIAQVAAEQGFDVQFKDRDDPALGRGLAAVQNYFRDQSKRRIVTPQEAEVRRQRVSGSTEWHGWKSVDLAIEAVFEDVEIKRRVLAEFEEHARPDAVFASNTSSLPITEIAAGARRPENVVGMHFFSPVPKMPLLEVIVTQQTSGAATATAVEVGKRLGKYVIVVNDGIGFYTTRILGPFMNEAGRMVLEGIAIDALDRAMMQFGFPVGPITLMDEVGLDVAIKVGHILEKAFGARMQLPETISKLTAEGRQGRKNGRGFYRYKDGKKRGPDQTVYLATPDGLGRKEFPPEEPQERLTYAMANEAAFCLQEGILRRPRDGDLGAVLGLGFPPFRGGPFRWMDRTGLPAVITKLEALAAKHGPRFTPAPILVDLARAGKKFHA